MTETLRDPIVMLLAGIGVPLLAALNAQLGVRLGSPALSALVFSIVGILVILVYHSLLAPGGDVAKILTSPPHLFLGGVFFAFYILSITTIAPRFGVGNAVFFVLLGQMISAAIIDQWGLFGAVKNPINMLRASGIFLMIAGLVLIQRA